MTHLVITTVVRIEVSGQSLPRTRLDKNFMLGQFMTKIRRRGVSGQPAIRDVVFEDFEFRFHQLRGIVILKNFRNGKQISRALIMVIYALSKYPEFLVKWGAFPSSLNYFQSLSQRDPRCRSDNAIVEGVCHKGHSQAKDCYSDCLSAIADPLLRARGAVVAYCSLLCPDHVLRPYFFLISIYSPLSLRVIIFHLLGLFVSPR